MYVDVELEAGEQRFYAGAFMDKIPLLLLGTCGTSLQADPVARARVEYSAERGFTRTTYNVA